MCFYYFQFSKQNQSGSDEPQLTWSKKKKKKTVFKENVKINVKKKTRKGKEVGVVGYFLNPREITLF